MIDVIVAGLLGASLMGNVAAYVMWRLARGRPARPARRAVPIIPRED